MSGHHLLSQQIDQQQRRVALRALATQAHGTAKVMAFGAAALTDEAFTAIGAFVHGVRYDGAATLEISAQLLQIQPAGAVAQTEGELLMGSRAIACAR